MNIAETILSQLGGRRFLAFTGSYNLCAMADGKGLVMKLRRNTSGANWLQIRLNGADLYDLRFIKAGKTLTTKAEYSDIYCDQLEDIFTQVTGLYTRL